METKYKVHAFYILLILISIIIVLVTVQWTSIHGLAEYLAFAATFSSLILAVLAIVYSIYSGSQSTATASSLIAASQEIRETSATISTAATRLATQIDTMPGLFAGLGDRVDATHALVQRMSADRALHESRPEKVGADNVPRTFVDAASNAGLIALYACTISQRLTKPFKLAELSGRLDYLSADYAWGYLIAVSTFGAIAAASTDGVWTVSGIAPELATKIADEIESRIGTAPLEKVKNLKTNKQRVDDFFATEPA
jgi:hypothetical protein